MSPLIFPLIITLAQEIANNVQAEVRHVLSLLSLLHITKILYRKDGLELLQLQLLHAVAPVAAPQLTCSSASPFSSRTCLSFVTAKATINARMSRIFF